MSTEGLNIGDEVFAEGNAPGGGRTWFKAKVIGFRNRFPPIVVEYIATTDGETQPLALPAPVSAYVHRQQVRFE